MGHTACTEPQCLYSRAIPLLLLWAVRPVQSLSACTGVHVTFFSTHMVRLLALDLYIIESGLWIKKKWYCAVQNCVLYIHRQTKVEVLLILI
jgi:hypothetical protein